MEKLKIGVLVGSLRKESFNLKTAKTLISIAPETFSAVLIDISKLQFFNQDLEDQPTAEWEDFRSQIRSCDAIIFVTPEYNRSVPAVLKNAIDVGSRPYGQSVWDKKPAAIVSVTPGNLGAFGANHHLRQSLAFLNMPTLGQPEAYISDASSLFDESGNMTNESTKGFLTKFMFAFESFVAQNRN